MAGLDRWNAVRWVDVTFNFSGGLLDLKGFPGHHRPTASVDVKQPRVVLQRLGGDPDDRWIFTQCLLVSSRTPVITAVGGR
jgi:hypothetical protein